jgi:hypothetical protein
MFILLCEQVTVGYNRTQGRCNVIIETAGLRSDLIETMDKNLDNASLWRCRKLFIFGELE